MIEDLTEGKLLESIIFANERKDSSLVDCLHNLQRWEQNTENENRTTKIYNDYSKYSFTFARYIEDKFVSNGGIIYHGKHDNGGDGSSPTFSVNITPTNGWQIHT